jgi:putative transposase
MLDRKFTAAAPNRIWLADITYIETDQGWLYLAAVMDLYSRRIVGWAMEDHLRAELPLAALTMAVSTQRAGAGLVHHSDRGVQYAAADYRKVLQSAGLDEPQSRLL